MNALITIAVIYTLFAFARDFYRIISGFFYKPLRVSHRAPRFYRPLVSVIIPAWNEEVGIVRTINSVIKNDYWNVEIIVVDDGSTDGTVHSVETMIQKYPTIKLVSQKNGGKAAALNTGIHRSKGSLIMTLDADSFLERTSLTKMVGALSDARYGVAIGEVVVGNTETWLGRAQHCEYTVGFHIKRSQHVFDSAYIFPGALTLFRRSVLEKIGDFTNYSSTEDLDISMRIKMAGYRIAYIDSALCITEGASTLRGLLNQRTRWRHGFLECLMYQKEFLFSGKKGTYLTWIDLPLQIFGLIEILFFPFIVGILGYFTITGSSSLTLLGAYLLLPFTLVLLSDLRAYSGAKRWVLVAPVLIFLIAWVEHIALLKSIYRTLRRKHTTWTVWQRTGQW